MNKILTMMVAVVLSSASLQAAGVVWSLQSGTVTVPAGETYVVTQADMASVNALDGIVVSGATDDLSAGVLEFRNCTTIPKSGLLKGEGVVKKTGAEVWTFDSVNADFNGDFRICGGQVVNTADKSFGSTANGCKGAVYVEDGASLVIDSAVIKFAYRPLHIAGNGFGSAAVDKALVIKTSAWPSVARLVLDADATVYVYNNNNYYWLYRGTPSSIVNLDTYKLTKTGDMDWYFLGPTFIGGSLENKVGNIFLGELCDMGAADAGPFVIANSPYVTFYNDPAVIYRPLKIEQTATFQYSTGVDDDRRHPLLTTNICNWAGDVTLDGASSKLIVAQTAYNASKNFTDQAHDVQLSFMGDISGSGSVQIGTDAYNSKGHYVLGGHNTYTGTTTVYGGYSSRLYAYWHDSIPDYSKLTVDRGYVAARAGVDADETTEFWPKAKLLALHNSATFAGDGALAVDASECANGTFALTATELNAGDSRPDVGWGAAGGTVRISAGQGESLQIAPCAYRGTLELTGPGTFVAVGTNAIAPSAGAFTNGATVLVKDGATVLHGDLPVFVGTMFKPGSQYVQSYGRLNVSNAKWLATTDAIPAEYVWKSLHDNALYVGSMQSGVLEIGAGGVVSNKLVVGGGGCDYRTYSYEVPGDADGAVYVGNGGRLFVRCGGNHRRLASEIGLYGYGYLQIDGGADVTFGDGDFGFGLHGAGIFHQYGGTFVKKGTLAVGGDKFGCGVIYVTNGVFRTEADGIAYSFLGSGENSKALITIDGPAAEMEIGGSDSTFYANNQVSAVTRININNGGRLVADRVHPYKTAEEMGTSHALIVSFDGGVLKKRKNKDEVLATAHYDAVDCAVYAGGASVDTENRANCTWNAAVPIVGHVSGGVQAIDASAAVAKEWIGAPMVEIAGDGFGATAVADWDPQSRKLKGVRITSHGWGYTPGAVTVTVKTSRRSITIEGAAVTVNDNEIGGFTKLGANTLTMYPTNSWQKWTAVNGGTLKVGSNGAIPANTELRLNGGTLDLNGFDADAERPVAFTGVSGTGGAVANGAAKVTGVWTISARKFLDRETTAVSGTLDLTGVTKIVIADGELLNGEEAKALANMDLFSATTVIWPANLVVERLPSGWSVKMTANGLRLGQEKGLVLIVR